MILKRIVFAAALVLFTSTCYADEPAWFLELGIQEKQHDYDFDLSLNGARYKIDNNSSTGYSVKAGWNASPFWQFYGKYVRHDEDNADGVILADDTRVQAPIFYDYEQAQLGVRYSFPLSQGIWLEASLAYQRVEQGVDEFGIELNGYSFGLDSSSRSSGWTQELALRFEFDAWRLKPLLGYDPHAAMKISADDVEVTSAWYYGARVDYLFTPNWKIGVEAKTGKVSDLSLLLRYQF